MSATVYPPARWHGGATTYGPLPDHGRANVSLVLHTTETVGMPGFNDGDTAPHLVYDTRDRSWHQWADLNRYVGTMKGHSSGHWNCQAIQVEILAYSDKNPCPPNGWWVGELANEHYADLAQLYAWLIDEGLTGMDLHAEPVGGWLYGTSSPYRLNQQAFDLLQGLTAHGGVGGNTHWDTGVLDLTRIWNEATDGSTLPPVPIPPPSQEGTPMWPMFYTDGFSNPSGSGRSEWRENVKVLQHLVNRAGGAVDEDGLLGNATLVEIGHLTGMTVDQTVTGDHANALTDLLPQGGMVPHSHEAVTTISEA